MSSLKEVCITAAKKVFDNRADVEEFAQGYLESAIHRFAKDTRETLINSAWRSSLTRPRAL
ncbi:hypothetical protein BCO37747_08168 [Burkholderia contaminans]|uniref:hypothetical protein n=1 Tax=Burkholderia contaminans TaxID=488447 RepID=UPI001454268B|nr:hypothetical protein [Burkholderia contaminans]VWD65610.1 hypothetical protein BCO37747_08168 [Burkholderia contaminans]